MTELHICTLLIQIVFLNWFLFDDFKSRKDCLRNVLCKETK